MILKLGAVVNHHEEAAWGVGKIIEVNDLKVTIQFSDGVVRKIASSHFNALRSADPGLFKPVCEPEPEAKPKASGKRQKKAV